MHEISMVVVNTNIIISKRLLPLLLCYAKKSVVVVYFVLQSQLSEKYRWIYLQGFNLGNKQLLSNMIDCKDTKVLYTTRIAFVADSYIFAETIQTFFAL